MSISIPPGWIMSLLFAGAYASAFRLLVGHRARGFPKCWAIALIGFLIGQVAAEHLGNSLPFTLVQVGDVRWLPATAGAWLLLFVVGSRRL